VVALAGMGCGSVGIVDRVEWVQLDCLRIRVNCLVILFTAHMCIPCLLILLRPSLVFRGGRHGYLWSCGGGCLLS
jgi:hypothetical protein